MEQAARTLGLFHCSIVLLFPSVDRLLRDPSLRRIVTAGIRFGEVADPPPIP